MTAGEARPIELAGTGDVLGESDVARATEHRVHDVEGMRAVRIGMVLREQASDR